MDKEKRVISGYKPEKFFYYFEEITKIPHGSFNEKGVADYLVKFADERKIECYRDEMNNVFMKIPASAGYEDEPTYLFQGHTDMVCEKNGDCKHDFMNDPLDIYIENGMLRARGTTLGGDDGVAVAAMLALLDGEISEHPAIECLFTTCEEVGLNGVNAFDCSKISATRMINMDNAEETNVVAGCAGGLRSELSKKPDTQKFEGDAVKISIKGLAGGHSGENINSSRENSVKVLARVLSVLRENIEFNICTLSGGTKDNAIPREAEAVIAVKDPDAVIKFIGNEYKKILCEMSDHDKGLVISCAKTEKPGVMLTLPESDALIAVISAIRSGVIRMSKDIKGLVEYSRNLGVTSCDENEIRLVFSSRSAIEAQIDASSAELDAVARITGYKTKHYSRYPGWNFSPESPLRDKYIAAFEKINGRRPEVSIIHAGLECGIIGSKVPGLDIISIGPDMNDIHSPDEALDLASCDRVFRAICEVLKK